MLIGSSLFSDGAIVSYPPSGGATEVQLVSHRYASPFQLEFPADFSAMTAWLLQDLRPNFKGRFSWAIYNNSLSDNPEEMVSEGASQPLVLATGRCPSFCEYRADLIFPVALHLSAGTYWLELHSGDELTTNNGGFIGWSFS